MRPRTRPPRRSASGEAPAAPTGEARVAGLRLLNRRDYTEAELRARLEGRGYVADGPNGIDEGIERLRRAGLLDDRRVAAAHVRAASGLKSRGRLRIARELEARGIARGLAHELLANLSPEDEAAGIARVLARAKPGELASLVGRQRWFQRLLRRGFSADAIARVIRGA